MNELKEQIDDIIPMEWYICEDNTYTIVRYDREEMIDDLMQLIKTYTAKRELEARIDELELAIHAASDIYHHEYTMRVQMIENRISQLKHQLSSQLCVWILAHYNRKENA